MSVSILMCTRHMQICFVQSHMIWTRPLLLRKSVFKVFCFLGVFSLTTYQDSFKCLISKTKNQTRHLSLRFTILCKIMMQEPVLDTINSVIHTHLCYIIMTPKAGVMQWSIPMFINGIYISLVMNELKRIKRIYS